MRASRSLFDWFRGRSRREQWFVGVGAAVAVAVLAITYLIIPLADRWGAREAALTANRERWIRLHALVSSEASRRRALTLARRERSGTVELLLSGPTPALAASNLQVLLQQYAEESFVELTRVDIAALPKPEGSGLLAIPVVLQAQGDIYGLTDFLARVQHGPRLLAIDEMSVNTRIGLARGDLLVWSLRAHGLYPAPAGGS